jgi:hypothetical protein
VPRASPSPSSLATRNASSGSPPTSGPRASPRAATRPTSATGESLVAALGQASEELGTIEVLEYSPIPQREFLRPVLETTVDDLTAAVEFSVLGPVTAVEQVLPGMRSLGRGTVPFVNGGSGARPNPNVAGTSVAFAGESVTWAP